MGFLSEAAKYSDDSCYILKNNVPTLEPDIDTWRQWYRSGTRKRIVDNTVLENNDSVLTIFVCDDLSRGGEPPEFFVTFMARNYQLIPVGYWATWEDAETGHSLFVDIATGMEDRRAPE